MAVPIRPAPKIAVGNEEEHSICRILRFAADVARESNSYQTSGTLRFPSERIILSCKSVVALIEDDGYVHTITLNMLTQGIRQAVISQKSH